MTQKIMSQALSFNDVLLVPAYSNVLPPEVSTQTQLTANIQLHIPFISASMDTVTEAPLAIALAQEGGLGILHKNMSIQDQVIHVRRVKKFQTGVVSDPIVVSPETTVAKFLEYKKLYKFSSMPVVGAHKELLGIVTNRDVRFTSDLNLQVSTLMTPKERLIVAEEGCSREQAMTLMHRHRIEKILLVDQAFVLRGMMTVKDILGAQQRPHATKDCGGQLRVGAALGVDTASRERAEALTKAGVDVLVIDCAHGHTKIVIEQIQWIKTHYPSVQLIGGNIVTAAAAKALVQAGVDAVKVGIGPGSICTTRIVTGAGIPQITAILEVTHALKDHPHISIIADGGICFSGDVGKAIAAGAHAVMIGGLFAGTEEAPGQVEFYRGRPYKTYRGMGSVGAMNRTYGSSDRYFQDKETPHKLVPEGVEGRIPYRGSLADMLHQLVGGLRAGMGYAGCATLEDMRQNAQLIQITAAGMRESHVHSVSVTKETPNYWIDD